LPQRQRTVRSITIISATATTIFNSSKLFSFRLAVRALLCDFHSCPRWEAFCDF
jgi:hypothetical protein